MKAREIFNYNILKVNMNKLLFSNKNKFYIIIYIIKNDQMLFPIKKIFFIYQKTKFRKLSTNIIINFYTAIQVLRRYYSFYNKLKNFLR